VQRRNVELPQHNVSPRTINSYLRCVNAYFMWLHNEHGRELKLIRQHSRDYPSPTGIAILLLRPSPFSVGREI
jgi:hypothetical protein